MGSNERQPIYRVSPRENGMSQLLERIAERDKNDLLIVNDENMTARIRRGTVDCAQG